MLFMYKFLCIFGSNEQKKKIYFLKMFSHFCLVFLTWEEKFTTVMATSQRWRSQGHVDNIRLSCIRQHHFSLSLFCFVSTTYYVKLLLEQAQATVKATQNFSLIQIIFFSFLMNVNLCSF